MPQRTKEQKSLFQKLSGFAFRITVGVVLGVIGFLYPYLFFMQDRMVFIRQPLGPEGFEQVKRNFPVAETLEMTTPDGITLRGWLLPGKGEGPRPLMLYFGGNAEEVSTSLGEAKEYARDGWSVALINYRGYGQSEGRPSEDALLADAEFIYDALTAREDVDATKVSVMGRSLGTGVAVHLASARSVTGVVLISPYDSLVAVAQGHHPYVPVGLLLKHRFDSVGRAPSIAAPMLCIVGTEDTIIPPEHSEELARAWKGPVEMVSIRGADHNDLPLQSGYYAAITRFLQSLL